MISIRHPPSATRNAFTLIEMLTTVAVLVILLGLAVSLARQVRDASAKDLTRDLLVRLDRTIAVYQARHDGRPPPVATLPDELVEPLIQRHAAAANTQVVRAIKSLMGRSPANASASPAEAAASAAGGGDAQAFGELPIYVYDQRTVRDTWGSPLLFMPRQHPQIGLAAQDRPFIVSAGPDRQYLTRDDNLYSYESSSGER